MKYEEAKFKLTGIKPILGGVALNKGIYSDYIATKGKTVEEKARGANDVNNVIDVDEKGVTGFYRDLEDNIILKAYQIRGFLKAAASALKDQLNIASTTSKIDKFVFVLEDSITITKNGKPVKDIDGYLERPLRGETAQGPRVSLAKSEMIDAGWELEFTIRVLENKGTAKSVSMSMNIVRQLFEYGQYSGLLQWRNGGYGAFTFTEGTPTK